MVCSGLKPGAARCKVQTNPLSYGGTPNVPTLPPHSKNCFIENPKTLKDVFGLWLSVLSIILSIYAASFKTIFVAKTTYSIWVVNTQCYQKKSPIKVAQKWFH